MRLIIDSSTLGTAKGVLTHGKIYPIFRIDVGVNGVCLYYIQCDRNYYTWVSEHQAILI